MHQLKDSDTIQFNIPGSGPFNTRMPAAGYRYVTKNNITIDGYSQPGSAPNTPGKKRKGVAKSSGVFRALVA